METIPQNIIEGIKAVREAGLVNMFDKSGVALAASSLDLMETCRWIHRASSQEYIKALELSVRN